MVHATLSRSRRTALLATAALAVVATVLVSTGVSAQTTTTTNITTYDYNNARSGDGPTTAITGLGANPAWTATLNAAVYSQPLVYNDVVYVGTEQDGLYALSPTTGAVMWHLQLGVAARTAVIDQANSVYSGCGDIDPLGITGTPVIDASSGVIYVAEEVVVGADKWDDIHHKLVAVSLATHQVLWSRYIDPPGGNSPHLYIIAAEQQRPALTLSDKHVYVAFGGLSGDCGKYHGWVVALPESGAGTLLHYQVPSYTEAAIWETNGAVVNSAGDLFVATGNGYSTTKFDGGDALIELSPSLKEISEWAPSDWATLTQNDWDLGSAGPIPIPGSNDLFLEGKVTTSGNKGYIVRNSHLGQGPGKPLFVADACPSNSPGAFGADASDVVTVHGVTETFIYVACEGGMVALRFTLGTHPRFTKAWTPKNVYPEGPPVVVGGYVWQLDWSNNNLYAMNPVDGAVKWSRNTASLNHFATPTVIDGHVFIPTADGVEAFSTS